MEVIRGKDSKEEKGRKSKEWEWEWGKWKRCKRNDKPGFLPAKRTMMSTSKPIPSEFGFSRAINHSIRVKRTTVQGTWCPLSSVPYLQTRLVCRTHQKSLRLIEQPQPLTNYFLKYTQEPLKKLTRVIFNYSSETIFYYLSCSRANILLKYYFWDIIIF